MDFTNEPIFIWLSQYAYQPTVVYFAIFGMMIASGFGLPIPEEVTIVSVGILAYMGANPAHFPPPEVGAPVVNGYEAALFTTIAIMFADYLVFYIGRIYGRKLLETRRMKKLFSDEVMGKVNSWVGKYGIYAAFVFRFTPGIRFPGHIILGTTKLPAWQFGLVDGIAAIISVPTQILLIYHFGEPILSALSKFKYYLFITIGVVILWLLIRRLLTKKPKEV